ncbi:MAG TPA: hypothetical protein VJH37_04880 [Candidatus Nanoarchaeia archaeon]|nr:hypothetical protein [Candidatus Nanoarchaeia archaeon]
MKLPHFLSLLCIIFLISLFTVTATPFTTTMEEGEEDTFTLGETSYAIEVMIIEDATPATVTFRINGQVTPQMIENQQFYLTNGVLLTILEILLNEAGEAGSGDLVTLSLSEYCGDNICSSVETCSSCALDCGCQNNYYCSNSNSCEPIECGDDICSDGETCSEDSCCDGHEMNLVTNNANCGTCNTVCKRSEQCIASVCTSTDKPNETSEKSEKKIIEKPKDLDQCKTPAQCDDSNPCTIDSCTGIPKKCFASKQEGCVHGTICLAQTTTIILENISYYCSIDNKLEPQKDEGQACVRDYVCQSGMCREGVCYVQRLTFFETLLNWFKYFL